jgi:hypothetical protein
MGMSRAQFLAGRMPLTPDNKLALSVWRFMGGWKPEALPVALAYFDIRDVDLMVEQLLAIHHAVEEWREAQRG